MKTLVHFAIMLTIAVGLLGCSPRAPEKPPTTEEPPKKEQPKVDPGQPTPL